MNVLGRTGTLSIPVSANEQTGVSVDANVDSYWGNNPDDKQYYTLRIGFLNINSFPDNPLHKKNTLIQIHINYHSIDVMWFASAGDTKILSI